MAGSSDAAKVGTSGVEKSERTEPSAARKSWWRRWKLYRERNGGRIYLRLRTRDRKYLIVKFWTHTYGPVQR